jgi:hypothetical protein
MPSGLAVSGVVEQADHVLAVTAVGPLRCDHVMSRRCIRASVA